MKNRVRQINKGMKSGRQVETGQDEALTIVLTSLDGKEQCRVEFMPNTAACLRSAAKKLGVSLRYFVMEAIKFKLAKAAKAS